MILVALRMLTHYKTLIVLLLHIIKPVIQTICVKIC